MCALTHRQVYIYKGRKLLVSEILRAMKVYCSRVVAMLDCRCPEVELVREGEKGRRGRRESI